jgi:hypothetical protein
MDMKIDFYQEPELEFGRGGHHIDVRYGLLENGPVDLGANTAPSPLKVGIVGTKETIGGVTEWLNKAREPIAGKESRHEQLFPEFPGFSESTCFGSSMQFNDRWTFDISKRAIDGLLAGSEDGELVENAVDLFLGAAREKIGPGGPNLLICAPPADLLTTLDRHIAAARESIDDEIDESQDAGMDFRRIVSPSFHDLLKAKGMAIQAPIQMIRPQTYALRPKRVRKANEPTRRVQDEATRAWNFHTTAYYKAGGVPWRMMRKSTDLTTCYVGISFYKSLDGEQLHTSVAQVFNELGEGVIVKGGFAKVDKRDRQAHLSGQDANKLINSAIKAYVHEHKTTPARVVIHKTSKSNEAEIEGFITGARDERIHSTDVVWIRRSFTRLFREGTYPPLRGTFLQTDDHSGILYLRGSVNFFKAYPGMYVPRPLEITAQDTETPLSKLAEEIFHLSKLNWNNTQFDGGEPITVKAARRVGDILKCVPEGHALQSNFRYFT